MLDCFMSLTPVFYLLKFPFIDFILFVHSIYRDLVFEKAQPWDCMDGLEQLCREHAEWQEGPKYVASWDKVSEENTPHVDCI